VHADVTSAEQVSAVVGTGTFSTGRTVNLSMCGEVQEAESGHFRNAFGRRPFVC
jgi:hypothetical protein